jgi:predicted ATPase
MRVYNLVTLFLGDDEIRALGTLIRCPWEDYRRIAEEASVPTKYVFYLTGAPGVGKTTVLRHLASLKTYDEWLTDPLPLLAKPHSELSVPERNQADDWVAKQLRDKNESLLKEREGVFVVERGPLDPLSFVADDEVAEKARVFSARLLPTQFDHICEGSVILLWGDSARISSRVASRQAIQQPPEYLDRLQRQLRTRVYPEQPGTVALQSTEWSVSELVRAVAGVIHAGLYRTVDLESQLSALAETR